jgi:DNA-directed RNA polymerase delta subunit
MNDSLIEIALREMKAKRKPRTLAKIAKDVFEVKGIDIKANAKALIQFEIDFMLSGNFICCGEDKHGIKLWDLKSRQPSTLLDKDGNYLEDLYDDDEEVVKNELKDDIVYKPIIENFEDDLDDEEEEEEEHDEIEEELLSEGLVDDVDDEDTEDLIDDLDEDDFDGDDFEDD